MSLRHWMVLLWLVTVVTAQCPTFVGVSAGGFHTLALTSDNTLMAWGNNANGQIGDGTVANVAQRATPVKINGKISLFKAGRTHDMAVTEEGRVFSWGRNENSVVQVSTPTEIPINYFLNKKIVALAVAPMASFALASDGTLFSFGNNMQGILGVGSLTSGSSVPISMSNISGFFFSSIGTKIYPFLVLFRLKWS